MRARRFLAVTTLALAAGSAAAGEARVSLAVGARVIRSATVRVEAGEAAAGRIRIAARAGGEAGAPMGIAVSGDAGPAQVFASPLSADIALSRAGPRAVVLVTVLPDGRPPAIRFRR